MNARRSDGGEFVRAAANLLVACQHDPTTAAYLGNPVHVGCVVCEQGAVRDEGDAGFAQGPIKAPAPQIAVAEEGDVAAASGGAAVRKALTAQALHSMNCPR